MSEIRFLGTGNYLVPAPRYWNGFVIDGRILVETSPTTLPNLRRLGISAADLDAILISHFHPDHTFGWPFLLLELARCGRPADKPLTVVGPPGVARFLEEMMRFGTVMDVHEEAHAAVNIGYLDVDGTSQQAGDLRLRAVHVEHVVDLDCYGFLVETPGGKVGYSGDSHPCAGLDELAEHADLLVLECNGLHASKSHMDVAAVKALRDRHPDTRFVLSHVGPGVPEVDFGPGITVAEDFAAIEL